MRKPTVKAYFICEKCHIVQLLSNRFWPFYFLSLFTALLSSLVQIESFIALRTLLHFPLCNSRRNPSKITVSTIEWSNRVRVSSTATEESEIFHAVSYVSREKRKAICCVSLTNINIGFNCNCIHSAVDFAFSKGKCIK